MSSNREFDFMVSQSIETHMGLNNNHQNDSKKSLKINKNPQLSFNTKKNNISSNDSKRRFRTSFEQKQLEILEKIFEKTHYPDSYVREEIAEQTGLNEAKVQVSILNIIKKYLYMKILVS